MPFILLGILIAALAMGTSMGATAGTNGDDLVRRPPRRPRVDPYREFIVQRLEDDGWEVED